MFVMIIRLHLLDLFRLNTITCTCNSFVHYIVHVYYYDIMNLGSNVDNYMSVFTIHKFNFTFYKIAGENTNSMILNYDINQSVPCFK